MSEMQLRMAGLKGGDCYPDDGTVWISKMHPLFYGRKNAEFHAAKQIALFRNPIDLLASYFNMVVLLSHSLEATTDLKDIEEWHTVFIPTMVRRIKEYQVNIDNIAKEIPTFYLTYEQLILEPEETLTNMFTFLLGVESLEGTVIEQRIKDSVKEGGAEKAVYQLKTEEQSKNLCRQLHNYTEEDLSLMKEQLREMLFFWGYAKHPHEENPTAFFDF